jgi:hypothetical protein
MKEALSVIGRFPSSRAWQPKPKGGIPESVRSALQDRLERHVEDKWAGQCRSIVIRFRGPFAYVDAFPKEQVPLAANFEDRDRIESTPILLCRLGYLGSMDGWTFGFFKYSDMKYEPSVVWSGSWVATPEEALDCAAQAYLMG